ncbi:MAG: UDP-glucose 4-epimerase GalE [Chitinophagales bacterium]|nr:UDP-glucose 4-epimerase GalE [Chitinophagales bacterium]
MKKVLVTGGTGYIGSHTVVDLLENGYDVIVVDNLSRSKEEVLLGIEKTTGKKPSFYNVDLCDKVALEQVFQAEKNIEGIIHFAAYKYVDESVKEPLLYYRNNVEGLLNLLECVKKYKVANFVFSSSCSVYGNIDSLPVSETTKLNPAQSPYASTKVVGELMLEDVKLEIPANFISLRYFNPVGAHTAGFIGENPAVIPNNLVPRITGTAIGKFEKLMIFGNQLPTRDGSCIRDYIHVMDVAEAHTAALKYLSKLNTIHTHEIINVGSGEGVSVLELVAAFEKATGIHLNKEIAPPREGDVIAVYSDTQKSSKVLNWQTKRSIEEMMITAWEWEKKNHV